MARGAILIQNVQGAYVNSDIEIRDVTIADPQDSAPWQVGLLCYNGAVQERIALSGITIRSGPRTLLKTAVPTVAYRRTGWT